MIDDVSMNCYHAPRRCQSVSSLPLPNDTTCDERSASPLIRVYICGFGRVQRWCSGSILVFAIPRRPGPQFRRAIGDGERAPSALRVRAPPCPPGGGGRRPRAGTTSRQRHRRSDSPQTTRRPDVRYRPFFVLGRSDSGGVAFSLTLPPAPPVAGSPLRVRPEGAGARVRTAARAAPGHSPHSHSRHTETVRVTPGARPRRAAAGAVSGVFRVVAVATPD